MLGASVRSTVLQSLGRHRRLSALHIVFCHLPNSKGKDQNTTGARIGVPQLQNGFTTQSRPNHFVQQTKMSIQLHRSAHCKAPTRCGCESSDHSTKTSKIPRYQQRKCTTSKQLHVAIHPSLTQWKSAHGRQCCNVIFKKKMRRRIRRRSAA